MTVLVTGFEPFGGSSLNASELVVRALAVHATPDVITAVLPTSYRRAEEGMRRLLCDHRPEVLLMLGLARGAEQMRFERLARNRDESNAPDNDGDVRAGRLIAGGAPDHYRSSLFLDRMADIASGFGEEVSFSEDAGGYVCNHLFFFAAHLLATEFPGSRCGFVHLPPLEPCEERLTRIAEIVRYWLVER